MQLSFIMGIHNDLISGDAGTGGDIFLLASDGSIHGGSTRVWPFSITLGEGRTGAGGMVILEANAISDLEVITLSRAGQSGSVQIRGFGDSLVVSDLRLTTSGQEGIPGLSGETNRLIISDFGQSGDTIIASAGNITLNDVVIQSDANGSTAAGDVKISGPGEIRLNDSQILSNTNGAGSGGNINFERAESLILNNTIISTDTAGQGRAGSIFVQDVGVFVMRNNSVLLAEANGDANGGNIDIKAGFVITFPDDNSDIIANAVGGDGGGIKITTNQLLGFTEQSGLTTDQLRNNTSSDISASSQFGQQGEITINNLAIDPNRGLIELPTNLADQSNQIDRRCLADSGQGQSAFVVTGRGGVPPGPREVVRSETIGLVDLATYGDTQAIASAADADLESPAHESAAVPYRIVEAQTWRVNDVGEIELIAQEPSAAAPLPVKSSLCPQMNASAHYLLL